MNEHYDFGSPMEAFQGFINVNPMMELAEVKSQSDTLIARLRSNRILLKAIERVVGEKRKRSELDDQNYVDTETAEANARYAKVNVSAENPEPKVQLKFFEPRLEPRIEHEPKVELKFLEPTLEPRFGTEGQPVLGTPETVEDTADTASEDSSPERKEPKGIYYKGLKYLGPTVSKRPAYKLKQNWEWQIYPHGISKQSGKLRVQIKQKGVNPAYQSFPNTWQGLLEAALFRDLEVNRLWEAGVLIRIPKFNFQHSFMKSRKSVKRRRAGHGSHRRAK
eukprot:CAMPEP_0170182982 /NCGR_PEP_ID=MMETSP0040_2-20121228/29298_1 /TAXON_ID=641309 /ORGANISM="Lotharella oceanica, Strain CCMP622" /LENGTH=277 /DNA_ID=CAMNT_0010428573 /DNA_START=170 /DNA_END=1003 /DNA_ORIENTATION=+